MIHNKTARQMLYDWHGGQWSAFYGAASSGLIPQRIKERLLIEANQIPDEKTRLKLTEWLVKQLAEGKFLPLTHGKHPDDYYLFLPWAKRPNNQSRSAGQPGKNRS